jgi:hypothetical protein
MTRFIQQQAFHVFLPDHRSPMSKTLGMRLVDTIFYHEHPEMTVESVRRELIDRDGYPIDIIVRKAK